MPIRRTMDPAADAVEDTEGHKYMRGIEPVEAQEDKVEVAARKDDADEG
jgi:hypothetical protein